jgi:hypothetical protein
MSTPTNEEKQRTIQALLAERRGYAIHGPEDSLKAVDAELKRLGHSAQTSQQRAAKRPSAKKASKR